MKTTINIDEEKLLFLLNKHTVNLYLLGIKAFSQKIINARTLLEELHEVADCPKETFIDYVNCLSKDDYESKDKYERHPCIDKLFTNIEWQGMFPSKGYEEIKNDPFIKYTNLDERLTRKKDKRELNNLHIK